MTTRVTIEGSIITWARERSGLPLDHLLTRFPKLTAWERGDVNPTMKQLEKFAQVTHTPIGYLFLQTPPKESLPIPDFRTIGDIEIKRVSPDLLDTLYQCQQRQEWYRDYAHQNGQEALPFVGSLDLKMNVVEAAAQMRSVLSFNIPSQGGSWTEAFRRLVDEADKQGILVMVNGIVGSNPHRKLNPQEFRGFALVDSLAPVVFINGADTKAAQIFTLVHELAHIWLGQSAISDADLATTTTHEVERWCNQVAAEFLLPLALIRGTSVDEVLSKGGLDQLARKYKVSTLVVLRRIYDAGVLTWDRYRSAYLNEVERVLKLMEDRSSGGGNFYNTQPHRVSKRFARALISSTLEGHTLHRDAFQMLGFKKVSTFHEIAHRLGVMQ